MYSAINPSWGKTLKIAVLSGDFTVANSVSATITKIDIVTITKKR